MRYGYLILGDATVSLYLAKRPAAPGILPQIRKRDMVTDKVSALE